MAVPSRRDKMIQNFQKIQRKRNKAGDEEVVKKKPKKEDVDKLIALFQKK